MKSLLPCLLYYKGAGLFPKGRSYTILHYLGDRKSGLLNHFHKLSAETQEGIVGRSVGVGMKVPTRVHTHCTVSESREPRWVSSWL